VKRVLIVEGNKVLRDCYSEILSEDGYEILTATGYTEALAKNLLHSPDVVIMDPGLGRSGLQAAEEMTRVNRRLRVVFHTAESYQCVRDFSTWIADVMASKGDDPKLLRDVLRHLVPR
jgi:CheY-like chemotaxis protein